MPDNPRKSAGLGLFSTLLVSHLVLLLHGLVILLLALLVVFFRGVVTYLPWILGGGILLLLVSALFLWRALRRRGRALGEILASPLLRDRAVEVKLLGGVASVRLGAPGETQPQQQRTLELDSGPNLPRLEEEETLRLRRLARLVKLHEEGTLSDEEFEILRRECTAEPPSKEVGAAPG